jgi:hypothetical protein
MPKRPPNDEYFVDERTQHVAQGDIFREVLLSTIELPAHGMLLNYTSGMLIGKEGTNREYRHRYRVVAPILGLALLETKGWSDHDTAKLREHDMLAGWMYLPPYRDEFPESAVALFRGSCLDHNDLVDKRVTQLQFPAAQRLALKLARVFAGFDPDPAKVEPDMRDHWEGAPE